MAPVYFSLYADLRSYDKACNEDEQGETDYETMRELALEIEQNYIRPTGKFYIPVDSDIKRSIQQRFNNLDGNLTSYLFVELYAFVLNKLKDYFEMFKQSQEYAELEEEIQWQEKFYEILVDASMITN